MYVTFARIFYVLLLLFLLLQCVAFYVHFTRYCRFLFLLEQKYQKAFDSINNLLSLSAYVQKFTSYSQKNVLLVQLEF